MEIVTRDRRAKTRRLTRQETHGRIMESADALFRQFGFSKTTVADIAGDLEMSTANIYKFFPSKEAIIQAGAERSLAQIKARIDLVRASRHGAAEKLLRVNLAIYRFHREHFQNERQIYKLVISAMEKNWSCISDFRAYLFATIHQIVQEGIRTREFRAVNAIATTRVLVDSFAWITNPLLLPQLEARGVEQRTRAQIKLLVRALK